MKTVTVSMQRLKRIIVFLLLPLHLLAQPTDTYDLCMQQIQSAQGEAKLEAYYSACMQEATRNNVKKEISLLHAYEAEAARQGNAEHEMKARTLRLYAFYNNNLPDSLYVYIEHDLQFLKQHKQWDYYYSCQSLKVELLRYNNKIQSALREAQTIYNEAIEQNINYGRGISAYLIASCYQSMDRNTEALVFFKKAENYLLEENNVGQLHNVYAVNWNSYTTLDRTDELLKLVGRWETMWQKYCQKNNLQLSDIAPYYATCLLAKAHAYISKNDLVLARKALDNAASLTKGGKNIVQMLMWKEEARYEEAAGNYKKALAYLDEDLRLQTAHHNQLAIISTQERRAQILMRLGEYKTAAQIYADLWPRKDSLNHINIAAQLDDLGTIYRVDTLKWEKAQLQSWMVTAIIFGGLAILFLVFYIYYHRHMRIKNRAIIEQYEKQKQAEGLIEKIKEQTIDAEHPDREIQLFGEIKKLLQNKELLTEPSLERTLLAKKLNTNYTYVANAVQAGAGVSVKKYITQNRIDYACTLLRTEKKYTISEIQDKCGFQSSSAFNRAFKEFMHMSPTEFQKGLNKSG